MNAKILVVVGILIVVAVLIGLGSGHLIVDRGVFGAFVFDDIELAGDDRQLLSAVIADEDPVLAQGGFLGLAEVNNAFDAGQVGRQLLTLGLLFRRLRCVIGAVRGLLCLLVLRLSVLVDERLQLGLIEQVELFVGELIATGAEALAS